MSSEWNITLYCDPYSRLFILTKLTLKNAQPRKENALPKANSHGSRFLSISIVPRQVLVEDSCNDTLHSSSFIILASSSFIPWSSSPVALQCISCNWIVVSVSWFWSGDALPLCDWSFTVLPSSSAGGLLRGRATAVPTMNIPPPMILSALRHPYWVKWHGTVYE